MTWVWKAFQATKRLNDFREFFDSIPWVLSPLTVNFINTAFLWLFYLPLSPWVPFESFPQPLSTALLTVVSFLEGTCITANTVFCYFVYISFHEHGKKRELFFGSSCQFRLERRVTNTRFIVSVNTSEKVEQLFCITIKKALQAISFIVFT